MTHFLSKRPENKRYLEVRTYGDCLEGIGIPNGGIAVIDHNLDVRKGDVVHCSRVTGAVLSSTYLKQVYELGEDVLVGTRYLDPARDYSFLAAEIHGVVIKFMDKQRNVVWESERIKHEAN